MAVKFRPLGPPVLLEDAAPPPASNDRDVTGYDIKLGFKWLDTSNPANKQYYECVGDDPAALQWIRLSDLDGNFRDNVLVGKGAGQQIVGSYNGNDNVAVGVDALGDAVETHESVAIGKGALRSDTDGNFNIAIGYRAQFNLDGRNGNIAIGFQAAMGNASSTTYDYNVFIGYAAGMNLLDSDSNVAIGSQAMQGASGSTPAGNVAVGPRSLQNIETGQANTCVGLQSGDSLTTGSSNIIIGWTADVDAGARSNCIVIGVGASPTKNGQLVLGSSLRPLVTHATAGATSEYLEVLINGVARKIELKAM
ncbi:hypothetical protein [Niveispirillum cyanobacteriorum]|uniref:Uncharacterized protein n=1 Tax=Niveispirillum cyanobacteriorum TaxID=1612173 RepID=A0A2K9NH98_9PROT|nr:hypothetical protein [Niveispirillum cyanobacteriorum]AUN31936.1 hypothetical protein C0V82_16015 [Niveispirillum cyanobacteriorum]GGE85625.1 hypothetical protein GCM10011317_48530 [Niveispirillum cyanobacteriorum]